jgi:hypothetical protein
MADNQMNPSNGSLEVKDIKVVGKDVPTYQPTTLRGKVGRIDRGVLAYVAKQMGRSEITGEVIGKTLLFQEDMEVNQ